MKGERFINILFIAAVFVPGDEYDLFVQKLLYLTSCHQHIRSNVKFQAVFPLSHPPFNVVLAVPNREEGDICQTDTISVGVPWKNYEYQVCLTVTSYQFDLSIVKCITFISEVLLKNPDFLNQKMKFGSSFELKSR